MPPPPDKSSGSLASGPVRSRLQRDIMWDRPVFRPPLLPNPRVIFDPLPFTAHRLSATSRHVAGH